ncbi:MAG: tRNA (adenosine(37)-N6)-threonylcarbamoyltransferase complex ATPase subunit type 1 TsaE [Anaerolineae bacterium]|nr:tRNA (adenosine(37)-N6)-threonylcarbamoyltransferase complex ATPase subunit type 1 TsaE [Anaerolineae bacterium]
MSSAMNWVVETASAAETQALGMKLARLLAGDEVVALSGELGTGKTTFVQGLARGLGITAAVTSPSFVLINRYQAPDGRGLQHADCYRLQRAALEMWDAGLGELLEGDDLVVIEWADRLPELLPAEHLDIRFEYLDENRRRLTFNARGRRYVELLRSLTAA